MLVRSMALLENIPTKPKSSLSNLSDLYINFNTYLIKFNELNLTKME